MLGLSLNNSELIMHKTLKIMLNKEILAAIISCFLIAALTQHCMGQTLVFNNQAPATIFNDSTISLEVYSTEEGDSIVITDRYGVRDIVMGEPLIIKSTNIWKDHYEARYFGNCDNQWEYGIEFCYNRKGEWAIYIDHCGTITRRGTMFFAPFAPLKRAKNGKYVRLD